MKPKVYTDIGINEARSPLVRVVDVGEWDLLMTELRYLRGERAAVVAWLREPLDGVIEEACVVSADAIERGQHREGREHACMDDE